MSTTKFLEIALALELPTTSSSVPFSILPYAPFYIFQMLLACGFILLKISNSFFAAFVDMDYTKQLFNRTIYAIRGISVTGNDLPERLAEVLAQVWKTGVLGRGASNGDLDASVQLKVRCRMSMSLVYDSVWRWREDFQVRSQGKSIESTCPAWSAALARWLIWISTSPRLPQESYKPRQCCPFLGSFGG